MEKFLNTDVEFRIRLLSRLVADCVYYLGCPEWHEKQLWGHSVEEHLWDMKVLYESFSEEEKPEWLSVSRMEELGTLMKAEYVKKRAKELVTEYAHIRLVMMARLEGDCVNYLMNGAPTLWEGSKELHIACMKAFYNSFSEDEKPNWISMAEIEDYEAVLLNHRKEDDFLIVVSPIVGEEHNKMRGGAYEESK